MCVSVCNVMASPERHLDELIENLEPVLAGLAVDDQFVNMQKTQDNSIDH